MKPNKNQIKKYRNIQIYMLRLDKCVTVSGESLHLKANVSFI